MKAAPKAKGKSLDVDGDEAVGAYIAAAPAAARPMLKQLRRLIRASAPDADERLSYRMPYYSLKGRLIYFAAFSKHVGVYIMGRSKQQFAKELEPWRTSASTLQFPFGTKLPVALLTRLVKARVAENLAGKPAPKSGAPREKRTAGKPAPKAKRKTARAGR